MTSPVALTPEQVIALGTAPDSALARKWGLTRYQVTRARKARGIADFAPVAGPWPEKWLKLLGTATDQAVADKINSGSQSRKVTIHSVRSMRMSRDIPAQVPRAYIWTADEDVLLGTAADSVIAAQLGCSRRCVLMRRQALGIAAHG